MAWAAKPRGPADSDLANKQPSERVFLSFHETWDEMSEEERDEVTAHEVERRFRGRRDAFA